jgi:hypothetical protein
VQFIPTPHENGADLYVLVTRGDSAIMTPLNGSWCRVQLQNVSSNRVVLTSWTVPYVVTSGGVSLDPGASRTLVMNPGSLLVTAIVGLPNPGGSATVKATHWTRCPWRCGRLAVRVPTISQLSKGCGTGVLAERLAVAAVR